MDSELFRLRRVYHPCDQGKVIMRLLYKDLRCSIHGSCLDRGGSPAGLLTGEDRPRQDRDSRQIGRSDLRAKSRERLKAGDLIRIYVHPEASSYVYVVHSDQKTVTLLNMVEQRIQSSTLVLPSVQEFYQVDGKSPVETFTIICSPDEVKEVSALLSSQMPHDRWAALEKELAKKGEVELAQKTERPFAIAGNVRGAGDAAGGDPFVKELQIFSGKSVLVRQYEFSVKK